MEGDYKIGKFPTFESEAYLASHGVVHPM